MSDKMDALIPFVDIDAFNVNKNQEDVDETVQRRLAADVYEAFSTVGFVCLRNHGIPQNMLDAVTEESRKFFSLSEQTKGKYSRPEHENGGWVCMERESLNPNRPGDLKEAFNIMHERLMTKVWPVKEVPGLRLVTDQLSQLCWTLAQRVLLLMGLGLGLDNPSFFNERHRKDNANNATTLRCLHYPPLQRGNAGVKPNQIRCGEHSDYGSITLLFQDDVGGLELLTRDGEFVPAKPVSGTVLVNIGDLMQRWTSDRLVSTKHRVVIPEGQLNRETARMSVAYFVHPDDDCVIQPIDGSNKSEPITALEYLNMRFKATY